MNHGDVACFIANVLHTARNESEWAMKVKKARTEGREKGQGFYVPTDSMAYISWSNPSCNFYTTSQHHMNCKQMERKGTKGGKQPRKCGNGREENKVGEIREGTKRERGIIKRTGGSDLCVESAVRESIVLDGIHKDRNAGTKFEHTLHASDDFN
jgi:hypothetical protein